MRRSLQGVAGFWALVLLTAQAASPVTAGSIHKVLLEQHWDAGETGWSKYTLPGAGCGGGQSWSYNVPCHPAGGPAPPSERWGVAPPGGCGEYGFKSATDILESPTIDSSSCLYDLSLELSYYLDFEEVGTYDRARIELGDAPFDGIVAHNGGGSGQLPSCAGGSNPLGQESLFNLSFWLPLALDLDGLLTLDSARLRLVGETSDTLHNEGAGFVVDDILLACEARPATVLWAAETFEDDAPGSAPGWPDLGVSDYQEGSFGIVATGSDKQLRASDTPGSGARWSYYSLTAPEPASALIEYDLRVDAASELSGDNGFLQVLQYGFGGDRFLLLEWGADGKLRLRIRADPLPPEVLVSTFSWSEATRYKVVWWVDSIENTVSVRINGEILTEDHALPTSFRSVRLVALDFEVKSFVTATVDIDDVRIAHLPIFADGFESGGTSAWAVGP